MQYVIYIFAEYGKLLIKSSIYFQSGLPDLFTGSFISDEGILLGLHFLPYVHL